MPTTKVQCLECGKVFRVGPLAAHDPECPRCHGVDIEEADD